MDAIDRQLTELERLLAEYHRKRRLERYQVLEVTYMDTLDAIQIAAMCRSGKAGGLSDDAIREATAKLAQAKLHGSHEDAAEEMLRRGLDRK